MAKNITWLIKKFLVITTILVVFSPVIATKINAQAATSYGESSGSLNILSITPSEVNASLPNRECPASSLDGIVGGLFRSLQELATNDWDAAYCISLAEGDNFVAPTSQSTNQVYSQSAVDTYLSKSGGALKFVNSANNLILQQRPTSGQYFVEDKVYALTNPGKVYAIDNPYVYYPGNGYDLLRPIYAFWSWSLNFVFGFLVLLIIVIAFAIMFRQRLGGSAEITLQNAIPSIAMALILVPLSYAISGLFIDAITLGTNAAHGFLLGPGSPGNQVYTNRPDQDSTDETEDRGLYADDYKVNVWHIRDRIDLRPSAEGVATDIGNSLDTTDAAGSLLKGIFNVIAIFVRILPGDEGGGEYAWFGNIINIIVGLATFWTALRIFWHLLQKYLLMTVMPIFSPFVFATSAIPGTGTKNIMNYAKMLGSGSAAYVVTYFMFLLTMVFTSPGFVSSAPSVQFSGYVPPLLGISEFLRTQAGQAGGTTLGQLVFILVGLGIYFSIPKTLENIDNSLGVKNIVPDFIKTPFDEFRKNLRISTRAVPALAARSALTAGRAARTAAFTPGRVIQGAQDFANRLQGKTPGDAGTYRATRRGDFADRMAAAQLKYDKAQSSGNLIGMANAQAEMAGIRALGEAYGTGVGYQGEKDKEPKISAAFTWKANPSNGDGAITFSTGEITTIFNNTNLANRLNPGAAFTDYKMQAGELSLAAEGSVRFLPGTKLDIGKTTPSTTLNAFNYEADSRLDLNGALNELISPDVLIFGKFHTVEPRGTDPNNAVSNDFFDYRDGAIVQNHVPIHDILELYAVQDGKSSLRNAGPELTPDADGKKIAITLVLRIKNPRLLFGVLNPTTGLYEKGLITASTVRTNPETLFQINGTKIYNGKGLRVRLVHAR